MTLTYVDYTLATDKNMKHEYDPRCKIPWEEINVWSKKFTGVDILIK